MNDKIPYSLCTFKTTTENVSASAEVKKIFLLIKDNQTSTCFEIPLQCS